MLIDKNDKSKEDRRALNRQRNLIRYQMPKGTNIEYKNLPLLQRFLTDRGKIVPQRISGISARDQRKLSKAIKEARFLALLPSGGVKR